MTSEKLAEKLDGLFYEKKFDEAMTLLTDEYNISSENNDIHSSLFVLNELMGLCRKLGRDSAVRYANKAVELTSQNDDEILTGTTFLNAGTVYKAFGYSYESLRFFDRAGEIYESVLSDDDPRLAGFYNNYSVSLMDEGFLSLAVFKLNKALTVLSKRDTHENRLNTALTYTNLCDVFYKRDGAEKSESEISSLLDKTEEIIEREKNNPDGYFYFTVEKIIPVFDFFGRFSVSSGLRKMVKNK